MWKDDGCQCNHVSVITSSGCLCLVLAVYVAIRGCHDIKWHYTRCPFVYDCGVKVEGGSDCYGVKRLGSTGSCIQIAT